MRGLVTLAPRVVETALLPALGRRIAREGRSSVLLG
jgi:hypothetical protein